MPAKCRSFGMHRCGSSLWLVGLLVVAAARPAAAQLSFESEPINYNTAVSHDPVAELQQQLNAGTRQLVRDDQRGYLESVLESLAIPIQSQVLVFSKTSFQQTRISPRNPRALYFNDDVYIGWVPGGEVVEVASVDSQLGAVFYTLDQEPSAKPTFVRDQGNCLTCHASSHTQGVPGLTIRSVYPSPSGLPHFGAGTFRTSHGSPLKERWGGWYVTGAHGRQRHMGNAIARDKERPNQLDTEAGANVTDLSIFFDPSRFLAPSSDLVALMVLEHQAEMHNFLTRASYDARLALRDAAVINKMMEQPEEQLGESTKRRLANAGDKVVEYLLFVGETPLTDPVRGNTAFAEEFQRRGPFDGQGRSLRQFDLERRMFRYPCSYLVYSKSFDALAEPLKEYIYQRLYDVLTGKETSPKFAHLSTGDRRAVLEILRATRAGLPEYWKDDAASATVGTRP